MFEGKQIGLIVWGNFDQFQPNIISSGEIPEVMAVVRDDMKRICISATEKFYRIDRLTNYNVFSVFDPTFVQNRIQSYLVISVFTPANHSLDADVCETLNYLLDFFIEKPNSTLEDYSALLDGVNAKPYPCDEQYLVKNGFFISKSHNDFSSYLNQPTFPDFKRVLFLNTALPILATFSNYEEVIQFDQKQKVKVRLMNFQASYTVVINNSFVEPVFENNGYYVEGLERENIHILEGSKRKYIGLLSSTRKEIIIRPPLREIMGEEVKTEEDDEPAVAQEESTSSIPFRVRPVTVGFFLLILLLGIVFFYINQESRPEPPKAKKETTPTPPKPVEIPISGQTQQPEPMEKVSLQTPKGYELKPNANESILTEKGFENEAFEDTYLRFFKGKWEKRERNTKAWVAIKNKKDTEYLLTKYFKKVKK
jgi:hypothetical protein